MSRLKSILRRIPLPDIVAVFALLVLVVAFFWRMVFTDLILPRGDVFTYFYPYWAYRNAALAQGRLPLWNPYLFMGVPFLANSQAGVLYPPNWLLIGLDAPTAVKVAIVTHLVWAAIGAYLFARRALATSVLAATLTAAVFALGGYMTAQVEHVNQLQGLAWLPWIFWLWNEAVTRARRRAILLMGAAFAMQLLAGHSQTAFISIVGLGIWALWRILSQTPRPLKALLDMRRLRVWSRQIDLWPILALIFAVLIAAGLAAAQILPTLELTGLSHRSGGLPFLDAISFSLRPWIAGRSLLPAYVDVPLFSEYIAYPGVTALILALFGAWAARRDPRLSALIVLAGMGLFLALGAYNPIYWLIVKVVPGFNLFRAPARWLALWAFAVSGLAGLGLDRISVSSIPAKSLWRSIWPGLIVIALAGLSFLAPLAANEVPGASAPDRLELVAWGATLVAALGITGWSARSTRTTATLLSTLAVVELFVAGSALPYNHLSAPAAWSSQRPAVSALLAAGQDRTPPDRFLSLSDIYFDPGDLREIEASYSQLLDEQGLYEYVVAVKQKEVLSPNLPLHWGIPAMDGFDGGILPTRDYIRFTSLFLAEDEISPDGRLRENLSAVPPLEWLSLANVRWIITDKVFDAWVENVYYDLQFAARQTPSAAAPTPPPIEAHPTQSFQATAVGIIGHVETMQAVADGTQIGTVAIYPEGAVSGYDAVTIPLIVDSLTPQGIGTLAGDPPVLVGNFTPDQPDLAEYYGLIRLGEPADIDHVEIAAVSSFPGTLVIRGVTLIDERSHAFASTTIQQGNELRLALSGDVKIYELLTTQPRAWVVCDPVIVSDVDEGWARLPEAASAGQTVIVDAAPPQTPCVDPMPGTARVVAYEPEYVAIEVENAPQNAYLVLADAWYPGWWAEVDGVPVEILHANGLFRAVRLPGGAHTVEFGYRSLPLEIGGVISGLTAVGVIAGLFIRLPARKRRQPATR